jgi:RNA-binding protein 25
VKNHKLSTLPVLFFKDICHKIDTFQDRAQVLTSEERRKLTKDLIARIPHEKVEIFSYPILWEEVDKKLANERILPWVKRKITEFLGEEDMDVTNYVVENVLAHVDPNKLLEELTEVFLLSNRKSVTF